MTAYTDLFDSITTDVITLTNRPDLTAETQVAVRTATLSVHSFGAYPRDLCTMPVKLPNPAYMVSIDAQIQLPRLRGLSTIQAMDSSYNPLEYPEIEIVEIGAIRDSEYKTLKNNIAYIAGTAVNVRCDIMAYGFLVEFFQLPQVRREQYNSWIAQLAPDIIVYQAASIVLSTNGNEEKAKSYANYVQQILKPQLDSNFLTSIIR
jgi:hypothetical protein